MAAWLVVALACADAQTPTVPGGPTTDTEGRPRIDGQMPAFLGADTLRALESAGSTRAKPAPSANTPSAGQTPSRAPSASDEPLAAAEADARRRAGRRPRQLKAQAHDAAPSRPSDSLADGAPATGANSASLAPMTTPPSPQTATSSGGEPGPGADKPPAPSAAAPNAADRPPTTTANCPQPKYSAQAVPAGRVRIAIVAPCQSNRPMRLVYGAYTFERPLDAEGEAVFLIDLFQGADEAISIAIGDGEMRQVPLPATDLDRVSKVAIVWTAPVNLDLHAYAYAANDQDPGHVWASAPLSADAAIAAAGTGQGRGFMSSADDGNSGGTKVEVYTFVHGDKDAAGTVTMALDYTSRGETPTGQWCGGGQLASLPFDIVVVERGRITTRESALIGAAQCGVTLAASARYARAAVPELRIRR